MHNIDFISEKWRTCRRTRKLAHIHIASSILPIIYVAVYAEAQRRDEDNKELGAALAALMFNVFQLMRTIMGLVQLNAFVAWCRHAVHCLESLKGEEDEEFQSASSASVRDRDRGKSRSAMEKVQQWQNLLVSSWKRGWHSICTLLGKRGKNGEQSRNGDEENSKASVNENVHDNDADDAEEFERGFPRVSGESYYTTVDSNIVPNDESLESATESYEEGTESITYSNSSRRMGDDENDIEDQIMVNNIVVDNELGGRDVTVLPSWKKMWSGLKKGRFTPSKWLRTDRAILNTVRWGGAYLCGMGKGWSILTGGTHASERSGELLESFFSREMDNLRLILQRVEWNLNVMNESPDFLSIHRRGELDIVELSGEMVTAYGNRNTSYYVGGSSTVDAYSFEFNSLAGSYPTDDKTIRRSANRERVTVGLVHSVVLAKQFGADTLKAVRRYYDEYHLPASPIDQSAIELLLMQTNTRLRDDPRITDIFDSNVNQSPIFPYRMQLVALWDDATNWRVLQASAHHDVEISTFHGFLMSLRKNNQKVLPNASRTVNIFDYCTKWTIEELSKGTIQWRSLLGVVLETVRTFLAEWITATGREPSWEPELPTACFIFGTKEIPKHKNYLIWMCQRELQREVAKLPKKEEDLPGRQLS